MKDFDLTPDTKVLIALTRTPMAPLDAVCELIDNCLDSFRLASLQGNPIKNPIIIIDLPKNSELSNNTGLIRLRDNGPGLTADAAEKCLRAGFSSNNQYDSLGLFGLGFNISTGKLGRKTRFHTARKESPEALEVIINLEQIMQSKSYKVPPRIIEKSPDFEQGTVVEISEWWPEGDPNSGFVRKLVQYGMPTIRIELGRRYASFLREGKVRILVNGEPCNAYEHCVWSDSRYVERKTHGKIPAVFRFDEVIGTQKRCSSCGALVIDGDKCAVCGSYNLRTIEERITGWVGIQRFEHSTNYGIDLIRNGRAIRIAEKLAFFEFTDELKRTERDYPIDGQYGRIVGEVHLNHVPVDFSKLDFQRSSPEWQRAMSYLRGDSSLQPTKPNADQNRSPIFKLYQGYRRVRTPGRTDMYMGYWDKNSNKPARITRDIEEEYYKKFLEKLPGFYDDSEWWKLVEQADQQPLEELIECPECLAQNLKEQEVCNVCGCILKGKSCINPDCAEVIPKSALSCSICGTSQIVKVEEPWSCLVCGGKNTSNAQQCGYCGEQKGAENTVSIEYLKKYSHKDDELSIKGCSVQLADNSYSSPIDVNVYITDTNIKSIYSKDIIPLIAFKSDIDIIDIFVDKSHSIFKFFKVLPEQMIASEVALYIFDLNKRLSIKQYQGLHTLSNIEWQIINKRWSAKLEVNSDRVRFDINNYLKSFKERLPYLLAQSANDIFEELDEEHKRILVNNIINDGQDISKLGHMIASGKYLSYIGDEAILYIYNKKREAFFDKKLWSDPYNDITLISEDSKRQIQERIYNTYLNCIRDIIDFNLRPNPETAILQRAKISLDYLLQKES